MSPVDLMNRYCEGDTEAFIALYRIAAPRILGFLRCLVRDRVLAEDLLQMTFLKIHVARPTFVRGADPLPWFFSIAHRTCLDDIRRRRRARLSHERVDACIGDDADDAAQRAEEAFGEVQCSTLLRALDQLPTSQRSAIVLTRIQGLSVGEAAQISGTTAGALKIRVHRGYERLRALLATDDTFVERFEARSARTRRATMNDPQEANA